MSASFVWRDDGQYAFSHVGENGATYYQNIINHVDFSVNITPGTGTAEIENPYVPMPFPAVLPPITIQPGTPTIPNVPTTATPEPGTMALLTLALFAGLLFRRIR